MEFEIARYLTEAEKPTEKPVPPNPQTATVQAGSEKDWDEYWAKRDAYYSGIELRKV